MLQEQVVMMYFTSEDYTLPSNPAFRRILAFVSGLFAYIQGTFNLKGRGWE